MTHNSNSSLDDEDPDDDDGQSRRLDAAVLFLVVAIVLTGATIACLWLSRSQPLYEQGAWFCASLAIAQWLGIRAFKSR